MGVTVEGNGVRLRDVTLDDADLLDSWATPEVKGPFNDFGVPMHRSTATPSLAGRCGTSATACSSSSGSSDGAPIGTVSWHLERYGPNEESGAWNIGIALIPEARGHGYGTEAQRLAADFLFATTPLHRVEASTDIENLRRAAFAREGRLHSRGRAAWRPVPCRRLARPRQLRPAARRLSRPTAPQEAPQWLTRIRA